MKKAFLAVVLAGCGGTNAVDICNGSAGLSVNAEEGLVPRCTRLASTVDSALALIRDAGIAYDADALQVTQLRIVAEPVNCGGRLTSGCTWDAFHISIQALDQYYVCYEVSLGHELIHWALRNAGRDGDAGHTDTTLWGPDGLEGRITSAILSGACKL